MCVSISSNVLNLRCSRVVVVDVAADDVGLVTENFSNKFEIDRVGEDTALGCST